MRGAEKAEAVSLSLRAAFRLVCWGGGEGGRGSGFFCVPPPLKKVHAYVRRKRRRRGGISFSFFLPNQLGREGGEGKVAWKAPSPSVLESPMAINDKFYLSEKKTPLFINCFPRDQAAESWRISKVAKNARGRVLSGHLSPVGLPQRQRTKLGILSGGKGERSALGGVIGQKLSRHLHAIITFPSRFSPAPSPWPARPPTILVLIRSWEFSRTNAKLNRFHSQQKEIRTFYLFLYPALVQLF